MGSAPTWGGVGEQLLQTVASGTAAPYYFNSPTGSDLAAYFQQIAINLANGGTHIIQLYPAACGHGRRQQLRFGHVLHRRVLGHVRRGVGRDRDVTDTSISITLPGGLTHGQTYPSS